MTLPRVWLRCLLFVSATSSVAQRWPCTSCTTISLAFLLAAGYFALNLLPGLKGNQWREVNLSKRGYELVGEARTETSDAAVAQVVKTA